MDNNSEQAERKQELGSTIQEAYANEGVERTTSDDDFHSLMKQVRLSHASS
ncbi:hypothetical protein [Actinomyces vulturis]|uniref:hypothetical protein n=1 Tax=Actinomyces vulturis TaxID=1857645 RepID=UPI00159EE5A9|nr:hypothetical protein [Actinomyces vulturis]